VLAAAGVPVECLRLEVAEGARAGDVAAGARTFGAVRDPGAQVAIDRFGTRSSFPARARRFSVDLLKLDRSFVTNIDRGRSHIDPVQVVAQVALNMTVGEVAQGIETAG
jgi:EAL domain-containing protein (putative c-di-GMP-specific phosphodiesterase class I)